MTAPTTRDFTRVLDGVEAARSLEPKPRRRRPPKWLTIGVHVDYHAVIGGPVTQSNLEVRSGPEKLPSGQWVVWLWGKTGCVSVDAVSLAAPTQAELNRLNVATDAADPDVQIAKMRAKESA